MQSIAQQPEFNENAFRASVMSSIGQIRRNMENAWEIELLKKFNQVLPAIEDANWEVSLLVRGLIEKKILEGLNLFYRKGLESGIYSLGITPRMVRGSKLEDMKPPDELDYRARFSANCIVKTLNHYIDRNRNFFESTGDNSKKRGMVRKRMGGTARTSSQREAAYAFSLARLNMFKEAGITKKRWICVRDETSRPDHLDFEDLGWVGMNYKYKKAGISPGIFDKESYGCRCVLDPFLFDFRLDNIT